VHQDDVGEGVDALLSLASMAHASSSCQTDSQAQAEGGRRPGSTTPNRPISGSGAFYK
jgi:hypothetical protein